ncbi:hypothetical protein [Luteimonas kalidii]|uniref:Lipoprotein n=1 Tax=Luteimonas kalidii TaxID=3042025 RepID=A0ABT6JRG8_9GAMM|nr:hypothetical protein [Luteimonas kalidii]MDH5832581.1 hypothetical protein [Luteimonas kalidii]
MPPAFPVGSRRRTPFLSLLASVALLAACSRPDPPSPPVAEPTSAAETDPALQCLPNALVSLRLPLEEGLAVAHTQVPTRPEVVDCVFSLFGDGPLKSPAAFDRAYGRVFAYHEEDGTLALASLPRDRVQLFRLGATGGVSVWLLRVDSGFEFDDRHHDVLFSTERTSGALVDQLLVGARGIYYRRDYDIGAPDRFSIREDTGRAAETGPGYRARYRVGSDGRFALESGEVLASAPAPGPR